jgi:hypothetical protein
LYGEGPEAEPTVLYGFASLQSQKFSFAGHTLASNHQGESKLSKVLYFAAMRHARCDIPYAT